MPSNKRKAGVTTCAGSKRGRGVARQQPSPSQSVEPQSDGIQSDGLQPISQPDGSRPVVACTPQPPQPAQPVLPDNQQAQPSSQPAQSVWPDNQQAQPSSQTAQPVWPDNQQAQPSSQPAQSVWPDNQQAQPSSQTAQPVWPDNQQAQPSSQPAQSVWPDNQQAQPSSQTAQSVWPDNQQAQPSSQPAQSVLPDNQQARPVQYQSLVPATKPLQLPDLGASFMQDSNMTSYNKNLEVPRQLSLMVYELLDKLGLSEEIRTLHTEYGYNLEISNNLILGDICRSYTFGSAIEGTQTPGMNSDIDMAFVDQAIEVFTKCSSSGGKPGYIVVQDETTPPGLVKLQTVCDNEPLQVTRGAGGIITDEINTSPPNSGYHFLPDYKGRIVITVRQGYMLPVPNVTKHGVAFKQDNKGDYKDIDIVRAFQSKVLPDCVTDCLMRKRNSDFITASVVEACKSYGCLFVRKEHFQSKGSHLLWRISPSYQERFLMFNFNSVQHKCYVLLKLIKKDIINPALGSEVLSSYHCKTAMLHLIDMTPSQFWRPDNLLLCLNTALHCLLLWSMDSNCPNFFIPDENMFRWRISRHLLKKLSDELFRLMSLDFLSLLRSIKTDDFNHRLAFMMSGNCQLLTTPYDYTPLLKFKRKYGILSCIMLMRYYLVLKCYSNSTNDLVDNLYNQLSILKHTDRLDIYTPVNVTQRTISLLEPYIDIYLMSNMVALSVQRGDTKEETWGYLTNVWWHKFSNSSDPFTSRLKQASLMTALGYHRHSFNVLSTIENKESINGCGCYRTYKSIQCLTLEERSILAVATVDEILHRFWTPCVLFLPTEKEVVPSALCYEMSITEAPADIHSWHDHWAIVDGKFLLHFLLHLNRKNLGLSFEADIQEMEKYIKNDRRASHKYTDLNLLGWVYKEEGKLDIAYECFKKSLHFRPQQKAAIWHILCLISSLRLGDGNTGDYYVLYERSK